ncbi:MAG: hypothetical protein WC244_01680 [Patescibacteria group bacterium]|jgi:hypothetical protein
MPRKSLPKQIKKPTASVKKGKSAKTKSASKAEPEDSGLQYINIYERNTEADKKVKLLWLITIPVTIILIIFWFWLLKQNMASKNQASVVSDLRDEITRTMGEIKNNIELNKISDTNTVNSTSSLDEIKDKIVEQLQKNLDPATWPSHDSEILAVSIKYPPEWSQNEQKESITVSAPSLTNSASTSATSTDSTYSRVLINRKTVSAGVKLDTWIKKNTPATDEYKLASATDNPMVDGQKTIVYQKIDATPNDINQIIYVQKDKSIYEIQISVLNRKISDEQYIKGIINNIKFL